MDWADFQKVKNPSRYHKTTRFTTKRIIDFYQGMRLDEIGFGALQELIKVMKRENYADETIGRYCRDVRAIVKMQFKKGNLNVEPIYPPFPKGKPRTDFLNDDECSRLTECCSPKIRSVVIFAINTGARKGEILNLDWGDVNMLHQRIVFRDTKNGTHRHVPMNDTVYNLLNNIGVNTNGRVFSLEDNGHFYSLFNRAKQDAELDHIRFHDLRHTFCSHLAIKGVPLFTIGKLAGHKSQASTQRYAHLCDSTLKDAVQKLDKNCTNLSQNKFKRGKIK